jgi:hypothetical protein
MVALWTVGRGSSAGGALSRCTSRQPAGRDGRAAGSNGARTVSSGPLHGGLLPHMQGWRVLQRGRGLLWPTGSGGGQWGQRCGRAGDAPRKYRAWSRGIAICPSLGAPGARIRRFAGSHGVPLTSRPRCRAACRPACSTQANHQTTWRAPQCTSLQHSTTLPAAVGSSTVLGTTSTCSRQQQQ